jgi:hypothetical protein
MESNTLVIIFSALVVIQNHHESSIVFLNSLAVFSNLFFAFSTCAFPSKESFFEISPNQLSLIISLAFHSMSDKIDIQAP